MPLCKARIVEDGRFLGQCTTIFEDRKYDYCGKHNQEYVDRTNEYKRINKQVEGLDAVFDELRLWDVEGCDQLEELNANIKIVETYIARLVGAIRGREEHHERFFEIVDKGHRDYLETLRDKRQVARVFLDRLQCRKEVVVALEEGRKREAESRKWQEYARAQAEATALRHCQARRMHDQHIICGALISPISHPECYCRVHRDELSGLTTKLERAREASTHARAALAYTMRRLQQRYASYDDAITDLRKYILVLNEQIKLEDVYLRCFGNPEDIQHVNNLKEKARAAQKGLDEFLATKEQVDSSLELVLGAAVSGISMYFGIPWGRSALYGALSAFWLRSGRTGSGRGNE